MQMYCRKKYVSYKIMCRPMLLHSHTIPYTMSLSHTVLPEYKAVEWETEVHLNMAMKLHRRISDIYRSHVRLREQFSFSGLSPNRGERPETRHAQGQRHLYTTLYFSAADCVCVISQTTPSEGSFLPLHASERSGLPRLFLFTEQFLFWCDKAALTAKGERKCELLP